MEEKEEYKDNKITRKRTYSTIQQSKLGNYIIAIPRFVVEEVLRCKKGDYVFWSMPRDNDVKEAVIVSRMNYGLLIGEGNWNEENGYKQMR